MTTTPTALPTGRAELPTDPTAVIAHAPADLHPRVRRALAARTEQAERRAGVNSYCPDCHRQRATIPRPRADSRCRACRAAVGHKRPRRRQTEADTTENTTTWSATCL